MPETAASGKGNFMSRNLASQGLFCCVPCPAFCLRDKRDYHAAADHSWGSVLRKVIVMVRGNTGPPNHNLAHQHESTGKRVQKPFDARFSANRQ
jgi:hypothetical protein